MNQIIIHVDMDAFYASVEVRDDPALSGKPLIIGALPSERGVVATCSYEARKFGVHSGMSIKDAYRLCPAGIFKSYPCLDGKAEFFIRINGIPFIETTFIEITSGKTAIARITSFGIAVVRITSIRIAVVKIRIGYPGRYLHKVHSLAYLLQKQIQRIQITELAGSSSLFHNCRHWTPEIEIDLPVSHLVHFFCSP